MIETVMRDQELFVPELIQRVMIRMVMILLE